MVIASYFMVERGRGNSRGDRPTGAWHSGPHSDPCWKNDTSDLTMTEMGRRGASR